MRDLPTSRHTVTFSAIVLLALSLSCGGGNTNSTIGPGPLKIHELMWEMGDSALSLNVAEVNMSTGSVGSASELVPEVADPSGGPKFVMTPDEKYLYATDSSSLVNEFSIVSPGFSLHALGPKVSWAAIPQCVIMHPKGGFVYASLDSDSGLEEMTITASDGHLVVGSTWSMPGVLFRRILIDHQGKFLYGVTNVGIYAFSISSTDGSLSPLSGSPFIVPGETTGNYAVYPADEILVGNYLYVMLGLGLYGPYGISISKIDPNTGALSAASNATMSLSAPFVQVVADPAGKFLYGIEGGNNVIDGFSIDSSSGALTAVPGSPFSVAPSQAYTLAIDTTGKFFYVSAMANLNLGTPGTMFGFSLDGTTGNLTPLPGSPFPAVTQPSYIRMFTATY